MNFRHFRDRLVVEITQNKQSDCCDCEIDFLSSRWMCIRWLSLSALCSMSVVLSRSPGFFYQQSCNIVTVELNAIQLSYKQYAYYICICCMAFNATFNNISVIEWRSVLLVEETGVPRENQNWDRLQYFTDNTRHHLSFVDLSVPTIHCHIYFLCYCTKCIRSM